jgi:hypothetical protein
VTPIDTFVPTRENPPRPLRASSTTGPLLQIVVSFFNSPRGELRVDGGDIPAIARRGPHGPAIARRMSGRVQRPPITNAGAVPEIAASIGVDNA